MKGISFFRIIAIVKKEFIQMKRDKLTLAMMVGIPIVQLIIFGFAINSNPKHLPTYVLNGDGHSIFARRFVSGLQNSHYFDIKETIYSQEKAKHDMLSGKATFVVNIPPGFNDRLIKGENPKILLEADSVDPQTVGSALAVAERVFKNTISSYAKGPLKFIKGDNDLVELKIHKNYNPNQVMQFSTVPSLLGVILTLTLVFVTALSMTREAERGTMENLLCMPVKPIEVLLGKIGPYIIMGLIQMTLIVILGHYLFNVPVNGNFLLLLSMGLVFIIATLSVGIVFSTIARNQLQAVQMSMFFFLPSIMLSGFMFPFKAMPIWAQYIGQCLPLTHFNIIVRGIMIKGAGFKDLQMQLYYIIIFMIVVLTVGVLRYRKTLD
jgi:ABC-2 type transport system permease protein